MFKLVCGPSRIGSKGDGVDREDIIANLAEQDDESSGEDDEEGIDIDLEDDDIQNEEEDDEEEKVAK